MSTNEMATNLYPQTIKIMPLKLVKSEETKKNNTTEYICTSLVSNVK